MTYELECELRRAYKNAENKKIMPKILCQLYPQEPKEEIYIALGLLPKEYSKPVQPKRKNYKWTKDEEMKLKQMFNLKLPLNRIADILEKTVKQVKNKLVAFELLNEADIRYHKTNLTRSERDYISEALRNGRTVEEISQKINRPCEVVKLYTYNYFKKI